jgi:hypothetical protein
MFCSGFVAQVSAKANFPENNRLEKLFSVKEVYEGYLKHIRPVSLSLTGQVPASFDWDTYKWEKDFLKQEKKDEESLSFDSDRDKMNGRKNGIIAGLPGVGGNSMPRGLTVETQPRKIDDGSSVKSQELLKEDDLIEMFGRDLNRMADGSATTTFEVPNSGFAPNPVLKSKANYRKE